MKAIWLRSHGPIARGGGAMGPRDRAIVYNKTNALYGYF